MPYPSALQGGDALTTPQPAAHHHSPVVRKQERLQRIKLRKRAWLLKMYTQKTDVTATEMFGSETQHTSMQVQRVQELVPPEEAQGCIDLLMTSPPAVIPNGPFDLLRWAELLDFDAYISEWRSVACSQASDAFLPISDLDVVEVLHLAA